MLTQVSIFSYLVELSLAISAKNTSITTAGCSSCNVDATTHFDHRNVWSLLVGCALTLLICIWHAIHPALPLPHFKRIHVVLYQMSLMLLAFFTPELLITTAFDEWREAKQITKRVHDRGYKWWTMTHSHFVLIGGFALCDHTGVKEINVHKFLSLVDNGEIANPIITEDDIKDKSTPLVNGLGKAVLVVQLSWFTTQFVVRLANHLSVTLVELDTACMGLLTLPLILFWWKKPRCPERPHIFYMRNIKNLDEKQQQGNVSRRGGSRKNSLDNNSTIRTYRGWEDLLTPAEINFSSDILYLVTWSVSGALHAIAWNYEFPTETEKTVWRVSSLVLAGTPALFGIIVAATDFYYNLDAASSSPAAKSRLGKSGFVNKLLQAVQAALLVTDVMFRVLLVVLMFASLRRLPSSAHQVTPWNEYINVPYL